MNALTPGLVADEDLMISCSTSPDSKLIQTCHRFAEAVIEDWYAYIVAPEGEEDDDRQPDFATLRWIETTPAITPEGWQAKALAFSAWNTEAYDDVPEDRDTSTTLLSNLLRDMVAPARNAIVARCAVKHGPLPKAYTAEGIWLGKAIAYGETGPVAAPILVPRDAKLIELCQQFDDLDRRYVLAIEAAETEAEFRGAIDILDASEPIVDGICQYPPTTCAGVLVLAGTLILENSELLDEPQPFRTDRLQHTLLRGLALMASKGAVA